MDKNGNKTGGREAGTPNKITVEVRELLTDTLGKEVPKIPEYLETLDPKEKLEIPR